MNILGLVFSLLLILSYTFFACWEKQNSSTRLKSAWIGHRKASRQILKSFESELYKSLHTSPSEKSGETLKEEELIAQEDSEEEHPVPNPKFNKPCAALNLWPLVQEGRETHPALYEAVAKLIRVFYAPLFPDPKNAHYEYLFLDHLLACSKIDRMPFEVEKIDLEDPQSQLRFYTILKGTKDGEKIPPLLEYIKFEPTKDKLCLFHAHPHLFTLFFGAKAGPKLYAEIHKENPPPLTKELIAQICFDAHMISADPSFLDLFELGRPAHKKEPCVTFFGEDKQSNISLKKKLRVK